MGRFNDDDLYVLNCLKSSGSDGKPLISLVLDSPITPDHLVSALQRLEKRGIIAINGPKNLSDLETIVLKASEPRAIGATGDFNHQVFIKGDPEERADYFFTHVRLTLRGRASAYFAKPENSASATPEQTPPEPPAP